MYSRIVPTDVQTAKRDLDETAPALRGRSSRLTETEPIDTFDGPIALMDVVDFLDPGPAPPCAGAQTDRDGFGERGKTSVRSRFAQSFAASSMTPPSQSVSSSSSLPMFTLPVVPAPASTSCLVGVGAPSGPSSARASTARAAEPAPRTRRRPCQNSPRSRTSSRINSFGSRTPQGSTEASPGAATPQVSPFAPERAGRGAGFEPDKRVTVGRERYSRPWLSRSHRPRPGSRLPAAPASPP